METGVFPVHNIIVHHRVDHVSGPQETPQLPLENKRHSPLRRRPKSLKASKTLKVFTVFHMKKPIENMKSFATRVFETMVKFEFSKDYYERVKELYRYLKRNPRKRYIFLSIVESCIKGKTFYKWNPPIPLTHIYQTYYYQHVNALIQKGLVTEGKELNPNTKRLNLVLIPTVLGYTVFFYIYRYNRKLLEGFQFEK